VHCPAFDDAKNFLYGDKVTKSSSVRGRTTWKSYVGLRAVREHGNEEVAMESMGNALRSKSMREGTSSFQESTRLRHSGEKVYENFRFPVMIWIWAGGLKSANSIWKGRECTAR
jgi:hypothetical protein